ncbi:aspartyl/asparaginyl beta-hydroxylase domain-containing protein [Myxococcota bacterium]|nr:aspartyl/asparaginyl beta-hydroxylase domain-containing protein [Myxococcota bacterium]
MPVGTRWFTEHLRDCATIRSLLRNHPSPNLHNLYWYDMRLQDAVGWRGIARVLWKNLTHSDRDEIAGNYGKRSLYSAETAKTPADVSNPPVWNCKGLDSRPWFDEPTEIRETLEKNAEAIIAEFEQIAELIEDHPDNSSLTPKGRWTGLHLIGASGRNEKLTQRCPETTRILETLPLCTNFGFVMFSGTEPGTHIAPHCGSSNLRQRHHLGVRIPEPESVKIRVGTEWRAWTRARTLAFDDSFEHEVIHEGNLDRIVLSVDVWHPSLTPEDVHVLSHPVFRDFGYTTT